MKAAITLALFSLILFACIPSQMVVISPPPTNTVTPKATDTPTQTPLPATPTVAPTETANPLPEFVAPESCDLLSKYPEINQPYLWTYRISTFAWEVYRYGGWFGDKSFYLARVSDPLRAIVTFSYKKDLRSKVEALPQEMWGTLPTNRFCLVGGEWHPLSPLKGEFK